MEWPSGVHKQLLEVAIAIEDPLTFKHAPPVMEWELQLSSSFNLQQEVLRYTLCLFASVLVGAGIRLLKSPTARHLYSMMSGAALIYIAFGAGILHVLIPSALTYLAMALSPKHCGALAWAINLAYLQYVHFGNMAGPTPPAMDFTGSQMVLFLKLISIAVCYQDYRVKKREDMTPYQVEHALARLPSPLQFLSYVFSLGNLLAGPSIEYAEYEEFIEHKGVWSPTAQPQPCPNGFKPGCIAFFKSLVFLMAFLHLVPRIGISTLFTEDYRALPGALKTLALFAAGLSSQFKYCFAWMLMEAGCIFAGLGFEGWEAVDGKTRPKWSRCSNVSFFKMLFTAESTRMITVHWNKATGNFLRRYVYERLAGKRRPGFKELMITQLVNAMWHGLAPRYLTFFVNSVFFIQFSSVISRLEGLLPEAVAKSYPWRGLKVFWSNFIVCYIVLAFHIIGVHNTWAIWSTVEFWPNILIIVGSLVGPYVLPAPRRRKEQDGAGKTKAA
ncbi:MBOAT, membrane-bound O-acyltransferase family-domain-containing protein [Dunaliella salina]|uniref:MBOAT, membrane-bound O-acyltransferase family-domain-containing protein n=1 Tax=Dunaliella salina TaxID=3046 RepID=A0ABQ7G8X8_DUNSA|nr:MBOAT, membrane-bound O-acyltransferase family-domain-containing protein [Dunaliella salina]|eukprot:KAF5831049.1 MBOAT, membrane-bound O-acyltransferase family-domain-containing protein [Dunaliella salina]